MIKEVDDDPTSGRQRHAWLDWLRAISILLVLSAHYTVDWSKAGLFKPIAMANARIGWSGVDFFFIISGFLIGNLLLGEIERYGHLDASRFYFRRLLKIWPLYYLACVIYVVTSPLIWDQTMLRGAVLITPALIHIQNYIEPQAMGHLWSLAVEEHFYVLLPVLVSACLRLSKPWTFARNLALTLAASIAIVIVARFASVLVLGMGSQQVRGYSHLRFDSLFGGVLLAWLYRFRPAFWHRLCVEPRLLVLPFLFGCVTFAFNTNHSIFVATLGYSLVSVAFASVLIFASRYDAIAPPHVLARPLVMLAWIGRHSYPIYLFHPFIWRIMVAKFHIQEVVIQGSFTLRSAMWLAGIVVFSATSIGLGGLIGELLERPLLKLRDRMIRPRTAAFEGSPALAMR